jgi:ribose 5-phosphate isomerase
MAVNLFKGKANVDDPATFMFTSFSMSFYTLLGVATGETWTPYLRNLGRQDDGSVDAIVAVCVPEPSSVQSLCR